MNKFVTMPVKLKTSVFFSSRISKNLLQSVVLAYKNDGGVPRQRKNAERTNKNFLKTEEITRVVTFIKNYADAHAILLPGRHPAHRDLSAKLLPSNVTKSSVYDLYSDAAKTLGKCKITA